MATTWLTDVEMKAWRNYIESTAALTAALEADLRPHGLTVGDYEVLVQLSEADEHSMRMCDLAGTLRLSPSGLTRRLDGLVRTGLVERRACEGDRRVMFAHLTEAGRAKLDEAAPDHVASVRKHLLAPLDHSQIEQMGEIFVRVREQLAVQQTA